MAILHVRLNGPRTRINIPSTLRQARFRLKSYRILFNREDHGYYHGSLTCTIFNGGNIMNFVKKDDPNYFAYDIPLFIDPEKKLTDKENVDWDLGVVQNVSSMIEFNLQLFNCIERKRFDQAIFDSTDSSIRGLYNKGVMYDGANQLKSQTYFGQNIPMYLVPYANVNSTSTEAQAQETWTDTTWYNADGTTITSGSNIYPTALQYVHTGVHVGNVNPNPGEKDYDARAVDAKEENMISNGAAIKGSGYRRGAIIYAYSIDLVFEVI
jgi:hypothetical protein